jgi:hypothetical protein
MTVTRLSISYRYFTVPQGPLLCSLQFVSEHCNEPDGFTSRNSPPGLPNSLTRNLDTFLILAPSLHVLLVPSYFSFITLTLIGQKFKLWSSSLCNYPHNTVTSTLFSTLRSDTLFLCCFVTVCCDYDDLVFRCRIRL